MGVRVIQLLLPAEGEKNNCLIRAWFTLSQTLVILSYQNSSLCAVYVCPVNGFLHNRSCYNSTEALLNGGEESDFFNRLHRCCESSAGQALKQIRL